MNHRNGIGSIGLLALVVLFGIAPISRAQENDQDNPGVKSGDYNVKESVEVGYRQDWINGNENTFQTFVGLNSGIRLLSYDLSMKSVDHKGILFDSLTFSNFGYGGDPENVSRLRVQKDRVYDFSVVFRRDKDFWDYYLMANPLIPAPLITASPLASNPASFPAFAINNSPHSLYLVRRMQDYDLTLFPQSRLRLRLGYSRDVNEGPSYSTFAGTTTFQLQQNARVTTNSYRVGVDFRLLPKTTISYDQFLEYTKLDTSDTLASTPWLVSSTTFPGTVPVNLGMVWYYQPLNSGTPCGSTLAASPFPNATTASLGYANPACKQAQSYLRTDPGRVNLPTERLSFRSTSISHLEMTGSASYNSSKNFVPNLNDAINEWINPSASAGQLREAIVSGPATAQQVAVRANWSGILTLTQKVRLVDSLNFDDWRNSGVFDQTTSNLFAQVVTGLTPGILSPIATFGPIVPSGPGFASICPSPYSANTCPHHGTSSAPDVYNTYNFSFLGQRRISNTVQLQADVTKRISGRIGYMYEQNLISETPWQAMYPSNTTVPNMGATYYPGGGGTAGLSQGGTATGNYYLAARGACAIQTGGALPPTCTLNADGSISYSPTLTMSNDSATYCQNGTLNSPSVSNTTVFTGRCPTTIHEQVGLAGLTLRPIDDLHIYADFEFGYNDYAYTRVQPRQLQSYKIHANYKARPWLTFDGSIDIHENRDNVINVYDLEHGRTYGMSAVMSKNENFTFTLGYNYTDIALQNMISFRDNFSGLTTTQYPGYSPLSGYLFYTPANSACPTGFTTGEATGPGTNASVNMCTTANYTSSQHYAYSDLTWKPMKRVIATFGFSGTFVSGDTIYLNPLQPAGTLDFIYVQPFATLVINIYKGLSYRTTWNYYAYNSRAPINPSVTIPAGSGPYAGQTYSLQPTTAPDYNGSTALFALRYAF